jgi:LiaI-LiaF-like transmembrane region
MAAPYGQPQPRARRGPGSIVGPLVLIFVGGVFLLQNAGVLPPSVWRDLWKLWPLVLVLAGLELLVGRRLPGLVAVAGLAIVVIALGVAASSYTIPGMAHGAMTTQTFSTRLEAAKQASVSVRFGAGQLVLGPQLGVSSGELANMTFTGPADLLPNPTYSVVGDTGRLEYQITGRTGANFFAPVGGSAEGLHMEIDLAREVPITTLNIQAGATDARVDLGSLRVNNLDMAVGAATTWVRMPESGVTSAHISGGASTITIEVPQGVAARIRHRGGLSGFQIDQSRFPAAGDEVNQSPDWDTAANKVDINLETGVTTIQVN